MFLVGGTVSGAKRDTVSKTVSLFSGVLLGMTVPLKLFFSFSIG